MAAWPCRLRSDVSPVWHKLTASRAGSCARWNARWSNSASRQVDSPETCRSPLFISRRALPRFRRGVFLQIGETSVVLGSRHACLLHSIQIHGRAVSVAGVPSNDYATLNTSALGPSSALDLTPPPYPVSVGCSTARTAGRLKRTMNFSTLCDQVSNAPRQIAQPLSSNCRLRTPVEFPNTTGL